MKSIPQLLVKAIALIIFIFVFSACPEVNPPEKNQAKTPSTELNTPESVSGLEAFSLEFNDRIHLSWYPVNSFDEYRIYRYIAKSDSALDAVFTSTLEVFDDFGSVPQGPERDTLYYYRVSSVLGDRESVKNANFVPAIYSSITDTFEPNNEYSEAKVLTPGKYNAAIFSFNQGEFQDRDYYQLEKDSGYVSVTIEFPSDSPLIGMLQLVFGENSQALNGETYVEEFNTSSSIDFQIEFKSASPDFNSVAAYSISVTKD